MNGNILASLPDILLKLLPFCRPRSRYSKQEALKIGRHYGMEEEVKQALAYGYTPDEALQDWDIYPYTDDQYNQWIK